ncbi:glyoxalase/bleomycin resistance protein/dioxygenase superfamily protein [Pseudomonas sp. URMO17WK12:I1]|uniref:VOC family protein n=1 Tax=unclassified Pseudomonas TaxID=196821 RepID=UPI000487509E|nr:MULTISPECIES: VOC family protein [unclassified Pseudomonas]PZW65384.1 glyoxalase/bleomycin resistance protein/dioxygenase superfamily protein [Pseudomonas sp. URMO17WK12:I1]
MLTSLQLKTFVPARDYPLSQAFYTALGFKAVWQTDEMSYFNHGEHCAFLLQNFYVKEQAENFVMHLMVDDVQAWWAHVQAENIGERFGVRTIAPEDQPWGIREFIVFDPSGVLWKIGQEI